MGIIAGYDATDPGSANVAVPVMTPPVLAAAPRIGLLRRLTTERAGAEVQEHIETVAARLAAAGAKVTEARPAFTAADVRQVSNIVLQYEAAQYHRPNFEKHGQHYAPAIARLVAAGMATAEADYEAALAGQAELREAMAALFEDVDVLLLPVAPSTAPRGLESTGDSSLCAPASTTGLPAISLPSGLGEGGLPLAVQLVGRAFEEPALLSAAAWVESLLAFDARSPFG
jgi:aspartyl-tRNA(Asn)/glutamyl-tRNA(Gln) amidotransferase subunit A